jgi:hypothetical protein
MKIKDPSYKKLEKVWYDKLKGEGFEDIENTQTSDRMLKEWDFNFFRNQFNQVQYESTLEYYERANRLLSSFGFKNEVHRRIWELHCEGQSERKIASQLTKCKKSMVHYIISNIAQQMKAD